MTWNNSNPLANPLNQGQFNRPGAFIRNPNASVPPSRAFDFSQMYDPNYDDGIHTPNQLTLSQGLNHGPGSMMNMSKDYFTLSDGTVLNIKTGKVVREGSLRSNSNSNYWGERKISNPFGGKENIWRDEDIYRNPVEDPNAPIMSKDDIEYERMKQKGDAELIRQMTPLQKQMLQNLANGKYNSLSNWKTVRE